jgi:amino acid transporter
VDAANAAGPGLLFGLSGQHLGKAFSDVAYILFLTSQSATLLSFHNAVARYLFALGREGVLPSSLSRTSRRTGSPLAGSVTQSVLALVVVIIFALAGLDPVTQLFTWFSSTSSTGVVIIMIAVSLSVIGFFRNRPGVESAWRRLIAPALAAILLTAILTLIVVNFDVLLGPGASPTLRWGLPGSLFVVGLIGFLRAEQLRTRRPEVYAGIGGQVADEDDDDDDERVPLRLREG